jgi:rfaE bifunctional protein nucleotidyltransferase chain/domain
VTAPRAARDKLVTRSEAAQRLRGARRQSERVVFTSGCFDLIHVGHVRSLEEARSLGDRLVVALNTDASVRRCKGADRPVVPLRQRAEVVAALACVDWVTWFGEDTPRRLIGALSPDVYAKGGDWPLATLLAQDLPEGFAGEVRRLRQVPRARTSRIVERLGELALGTQTRETSKRRGASQR